MKSIIKRSIIKAIKFYQTFISPSLGVNCRFYPSCSQYTLISVQKYGPLKGCFKGLKRILKCHPLSQGGADMP